MKRVNMCSVVAKNLMSQSENYRKIGVQQTTISRNLSQVSAEKILTNCLDDLPRCEFPVPIVASTTADHVSVEGSENRL